MIPASRINWRASIAALLILAWATLFYACAPGGSKTVPATGATTSTVSLQAAEAPSSEVAAMIHTVQEHVSELRSLASRAPVVYQPLTPAQLGALVRREIEKQMPPDERRDIEFALRRLRLLSEKQSLDEIIVGLYSEQVAGLYDQDTKRLYVVTSFNLKTSLAETILAHEICHALQDQYYDLKKWPLEEHNNDDRVLAAAAVLEGDATVLMTEYALTYIKSKRWIQELPSLLVTMGAGQPQLEAAPYFLQRELIFPYVDGQTFMQKAIVENEREKVMRSVPRSTEQILHPDKYFAAKPDDPVEIDIKPLDKAAPKGWKCRFHNCMGEFGIRTFLEASFYGKAQTASEGWGGDRFALYGPSKSDIKESAYALVWLTAWDTQQDAAEFARAMRSVAAQRLMETEAVKERDGLWVFKTQNGVALLRQSGLSVVYVDACSEKIARAFLAKCGP
ncbi:MAG: hypothetical protein NTX50_13955 [Candidatus Sumerlaeota bacterium]|nr:hypothetical protein [Candidatus Sumerlaeota bacterium]